MFDKGQKKNPPPWGHTQRKFTVARDKKVDTLGYAPKDASLYMHSLFSSRATSLRA
jgi:hypothetical protein